jgi:multidrug resistance efflux pump
MYPKVFRVFAALLLFAMLLAACGGGDGGGGEEPAQPGETPQQKEVSRSGAVTASGRVVPAKYADLSFATSGQVAEILVQEGQQVGAGTVLARLQGIEQANAELAAAEQERLEAQQALDNLTDNLDVAQIDALKKLNDARQEKYDADRDLSYQAAASQTFQKGQAETRVDIAEARVSQAQREYDLLLAGPDPKQVATAEARLKSADARVKSAQAAVANLELRAPFAGTVVMLKIHQGEQASPGLPAMTLADLSNWVVETDDLTEIEVVRINVGQPVSLVPDALPDVRMTGTVTAIRNIFEEKRGDITYTATISITEIDPRLRWGMTIASNFQQ